MIAYMKLSYMTYECMKSGYMTYEYMKSGYMTYECIHETQLYDLRVHA